MMLHNWPLIDRQPKQRAQERGEWLGRFVFATASMGLFAFGLHLAGLDWAPALMLTFAGRMLQK